MSTKLSETRNAFKNCAMIPVRLDDLLEAICYTGAYHQAEWWQRLRAATKMGGWEMKKK